MPRDTYTPPDWDAGEIAARNTRAAAYLAAKLAERDERQARKTRRQVHMFCAAIVGIGAASVIAQVW